MGEIKSGHQNEKEAQSSSKQLLKLRSALKYFTILHHSSTSSPEPSLHTKHQLAIPTRLTITPRHFKSVVNHEALHCNLPCSFDLPACNVRTTSAMCKPQLINPQRKSRTISSPGYHCYSRWSSQHGRHLSSYRRRRNAS